MGPVCTGFIGDTTWVRALPQVVPALEDTGEALVHL